MNAHLVWDWNGTLFNDFEAVVGATNASFAELGLPPVTAERYRELYCIPVPLFYERLLGRRPSDEEWTVMDAGFHRHYWTLAEGCGLAEGAAELLAARQAMGATQSLCSLAPHQELMPFVAAHGISGHFQRIDGRTGPASEGKAGQMARHLAALEGLDGRPVVVIGDALDDAAAAAHVGAFAVLYTGGSHSRATLESVGVPVVDSLAEAVRLAERIAS
ncbi:Phosphoglycolate phosphatase, HAD superfamily [Actinacidiphila yanglinensis]|uniref:Phosphoglycolate phosphatase, HAD superfamily n=1 Tax=Actinacidiphila yanglinensis TaxID=310779 RepID=A0A1H6CZ96_9ACTN|nr:HAD family hydrolase [Actinacidiphila yanglinensis]SEG78461.1 Phosphoglycolate phosphatase, HAD superfamily [Actinacidiphila yanglinensis]